MEDNRIVDLYWARSEDAITETSEKYGKYCYSIAYNILSNAEDADESVNDTYLDAWHNMPPHRPSILSTFLGKITRRISIDKWRGRTADKRGGGEIVLALDELADCVPSDHSVEHEVEAAALEKIRRCKRKSSSLPPKRTPTTTNTGRKKPVSRSCISLRAIFPKSCKARKTGRKNTNRSVKNRPQTTPKRGYALHPIRTTHL